MLPALLPGALVVWMSFEAGGYFARDTALAGVVVALVVAFGFLLRERPLAGLTVDGAVVCGALLLLAGWTLWSAAWSESDGRAVFEVVRTLLYLLVVFSLAVLPFDRLRLRWLVRGLALACVVVAGCALITRLLPEVWPTEANVSNDRLSYPLTYWNALGALCGIGILLSFVLTSDLRESRVVRILAAGALPILATALFFTFSRAGIALTVVGLVAVIPLARTSGAASGVIVLPASAVAVAAAYNADLLTSLNPTTPAAVAEGKDLLPTILLAIAASMAIRWMLTLRFDGRLARARIPKAPLTRRRVGWALTVGLSVLAVGLAAGGAVKLQDQYDRFVQGGNVAEETDLRQRLVDPGNNGRITQWNAATDGFAADRLKGLGAGTYRLTWDRVRTEQYDVEDAHSLYLEMLAELGVVGLLLLLVAVVTILVALVKRVRGEDRVLYAALTAVAVFWAVHAGIDWDWELPAVTIPFFAAGGIALGARLRAAPAVAGAAAAAAPDAVPVLAGGADGDEPPARLDRRVPWPWRAGFVVALLLVVVPLVVLVRSERAAQAAKVAFAARDCDTVVREANLAIDRLDVRPEPFELLGYCDLRTGRVADGIRQFSRAVEHDPYNWRVHYGLALALAVAEQDPRPQIKIARTLNPKEPLAEDASRSFWETTDPRGWRDRATKLRLPTN